MPCWASRIALESTGVHMERLQDIGRGEVMPRAARLPTWQPAEIRATCTPNSGTSCMRPAHGTPTPGSGLCRSAALEPDIPTITNGTLFLARSQAVGTTTPRSEFQLRMHLVDRPAQGFTVPYVVNWTDPATTSWVNQMQAALVPGHGVQIEPLATCSMPGLRAFQIHATVPCCELAPLAPGPVPRLKPDTTSPRRGTCSD